MPHKNPHHAVNRMVFENARNQKNGMGKPNRYRINKVAEGVELFDPKTQAFPIIQGRIIENYVSYNMRAANARKRKTG